MILLSIIYIKILKTPVFMRTNLRTIAIFQTKKYWKEAIFCWKNPVFIIIFAFFRQTIPIFTYFSCWNRVKCIWCKNNNWFLNTFTIVLNVNMQINWRGTQTFSCVPPCVPRFCVPNSCKTGAAWMARKMQIGITQSRLPQRWVCST